MGRVVERRTASSARPSASPNPNLLSCWPVCTKSCVFGRTPGRDAHEHLLLLPASGRGRLEPVDLLERVDHEVADAQVEAELDLGHRLVIAVEVDARGGKPAARAAASSPPVATSSERSSWATSSHIARQLKALLAYTIS